MAGDSKGYRVAKRAVAALLRWETKEPFCLCLDKQSGFPK